jgi:hypothetical protein
VNFGKLQNCELLGYSFYPLINHQHYYNNLQTLQLKLYKYQEDKEVYLNNLHTENEIKSTLFTFSKNINTVFPKNEKLGYFYYQTNEFYKFFYSTFNNDINEKKKIDFKKILKFEFLNNAKIFKSLFEVNFNQIKNILPIIFNILLNFVVYSNYIDNYINTKDFKKLVFNEHKNFIELNTTIQKLQQFSILSFQSFIKLLNFSMLYEFSQNIPKNEINKTIDEYFKNNSFYFNIFKEILVIEEEKVNLEYEEIFGKKPKEKEKTFTFSSYNEIIINAFKKHLENEKFGLNKEVLIEDEKNYFIDSFADMNIQINNDEINKDYNEKKRFYKEYESGKLQTKIKEMLSKMY